MAEPAGQEGVKRLPGSVSPRIQGRRLPGRDNALPARAISRFTESG